MEFKDNIAKLHCLPNGNEDDSFDITVDVEKKQLLFSSCEKNNYMVHAMYKIFDIFDETKTVPNETASIWY